MALSTVSESELLTALYDGPFEQPLWSTFLDRLRRQVGAAYVGLFFLPPKDIGGSVIEYYSGRLPPPELRRRYLETADQDPLPYFDLREERVYATSELLDPTNPVHAAFRRDMAIPSGFGFGRIVRVIEPGGVSAWLTVNRGDRDFTAADSALLSGLAPHLRRALRSYFAVERERFRGDVAAQAIQRLDFGWLSLDSSGRILETSPHAVRLLQRCPDLSIGRHRRLSARTPALDREITAAVKACIASSAARPRALQISREPWIDLLLVPVQDRHPATGPTPAAIAYLQGDNRSTTDRHEQIAELFGLLPSEARLALALSRGMTIAEAAEHLGLTVETARNYSKKIYAKMGARGQTDLIRFILASVLAIA